MADVDIYRDYVLTMLFLKYVSYIWLDHYETDEKERFVLPTDANYFALCKHRHQPGNGEFSYVMDMDALCEIAPQHPTSREQVIIIYIDYMDHPDTQADTLNGLLMACLMDLKAAEAIDVIRHLFAARPRWAVTIPVPATAVKIQKFYGLN
jgi:hypothetical protein